MKRPTTFRALVATAVAASRELATSDSHEHNKLSRSAFREAGLSLGGLGEAEAKALRDRLAGSGFAATRAAVADVVGRFREPSTWDPFLPSLPVEARVELQGEGVPIRRLAALAAVEACEGSSGSFGTAAVAGEGADRADGLRGKLAALCLEIEAAAQLSDFELVPHPGERERGEGWCKVFVAGTPVTAGPGFGARLVAWCEREGLGGLPEAAPAARVA